MHFVIILFPTLFIECVKGKYGKGCSNFCSNCANDECYPDSGRCKIGCKDGWKGDMCKTGRQYNDMTKYRSNIFFNNAALFRSNKAIY